MVDMAYLGLSIDSSQADKAVVSLKQLSGAAKGAEAASNGFTQSSQKSAAASHRVAAASHSLQAAQQRLAIAQKRVNDLMDAGPQPFERMTRATAQLAAANAAVAKAQAAAESAAHAQTVAANQNSAANAKAAIATQAAAVAQVQLAQASRQSAFQQRMLAFQLNDVFVSLASGMNPMMVAIQQGSQMAQVYSGEGGLGRALKESALMVGRLVGRFPVLTGVVAATGVAFLGMAHEISEATGKSVTFGDVAVASFQVVRDGIATVLQPAIAAIGPYFSATWNAVIAATKFAGNTVIGVMVGAYRFITETWDNLPAVFGDLFELVKFKAKDAFAVMAQDAIRTVNTLIDGVNSVADRLGIGQIGRLDPQSIQLPDMPDLTGALERPLEAWREALNTDYLGQFYEAVKANVIAGLEETEDAADGAGRAIRAAANDSIDPWKNLRTVTADVTDTFKDARQDARSFFGDIVDGFNQGKSAAEVFTTALTNLANRLLSRGLDMLANILFPSVPAFAAGTNYAPGGMALVGERGPELVNLPRGSQVVPNHKLGGAMGGYVDNRVITVNAPNATPETVEAIRRVAREEIGQYDKSALERHVNLQTRAQRWGMV